MEPRRTLDCWVACAEEEEGAQPGQPSAEGFLRATAKSRGG